ncbi:MAG: LamB/YcsF family protein [Firmicutes bacterium]|nr:LamB/YcsF family protein [Bacillota bacterium]
MHTVDLNCDMGESFGRYTLGQDEDVLAYITSANIACGFHAGDPLVMDTTVALAKKNGVAVGAHPSFPDLQGFGRRAMTMGRQELTALMIYQIGALKAFAEYYGTTLQHVKLHGALYNMACCEEQPAAALVDAVQAIDSSLVLVALYGSQMYRQGEKAGLRVAGEFFADRNYSADGTLLTRSHKKALIDDEEDAVQRTLQAILTGTIIAVDGTPLEVKADTICLHGDSPTALAFARRLREALTEAGIAIKAMDSFL